MSKMLLASALVGFAALALPLTVSADSGHVVDSGSEHSGVHEGHGATPPQPTDLASAWANLMAARDAIAADVESGTLKAVHEKAEPLPDLVTALVERSGELDAGKRARVEGAAKQVARVADALHEAADRGDADRTRKELSRLDGLLALIRAQYSAGALGAGGGHHEGHAAEPTHAHAAHAHAERSAGLVDATPHATLRVQASDPFRFEPKHMQVQAGVPTRIELANLGAAEHSLVVKTPDGARDWVHLHALAGETEAGTYELDEPGTYPVLCTVPGHTEAGMVGEIVVRSGP